METNVFTPQVEYKPLYFVSPENTINELNKHMLTDGFDFVLDLDKSRDATLFDGHNGREFTDFFSFFASSPLGMNHPKMMSEEFINYIGRVALNKPSNSDIYTSEMATFVKTFFTVAVPPYMKYAFFIDGGALAVENALKTAFDWKVKKNFKKGHSRELGSQVIHFRQAFHGRTGYTMSLTNTDPVKVMNFPKFQWPRITNPKLTFPLTPANLEHTIALEKQAIEEIKQASLLNKDDIAAIIIEPIQGEGGDNHFRKEFLQNLRVLADENEALLIFDEVQTGVAMTGEMWAHQNYEVEPDIMCFGKKMQVCGILAGKRIDEVDDNVFHVSSRINSTWGGNLVDMVRATRFLEIIQEDDLIDNVRLQGRFLIDQLDALSVEYPHLISNVRGKGLFCAFDMPNDQLRTQFRNKCYENGLIILGCGDKSIRFRPALTVTKDNLKDGLDIMRDVLNAM